ncbi:MAG: hypothetical protein SVW57_08230 [Thermodesulfobacteriota bacterium]|nr:hypothetical protein [Thermodesulfobacteriota bacterium]
MIIDDGDSHFIFVYHPDTVFGMRSYIRYEGKPVKNKEYLEHWGKWIVLAERKKLDELAQKLDPHVEQGIIPCIKYDRIPPTHLGINECVMCIFCDGREKDEVWKILSDLGAEQKAWIYERETIEMWSPGGRLLENWIAREGMSEEEAEEIREEAKQRFLEVYGDPDAICTGWAQ